MNIDRLVSSQSSFVRSSTRPAQPPRSILAFLGLALALALTPAQALLFSIQDPDRTAAPGSTTLFTGTITNDTSVDLSATDLFLDFSGFDVNVVSLTQLLGEPDFTIPHGSTTPVTDLFDATLGLSAPPATYFVDVILQDVRGNVAGPVTVTLQVPEPPAIVLLTLGLAVVMVAARRRKNARDLALPYIRH